jgi:signal transduction histidine kinase
MERHRASDRYIADVSDPVPTPEQAVLRQLDEAQKQLDQLHHQLTETQRMATIGTIAAVIAHEFNNLLTPIVSYSQFALTSAQSDKPDMPLICKALSKAFASAEKAGKICASMLNLARGQTTFAPVSIQDIVNETLTVLARDPQKDGIALRLQVQPDLYVLADPIQVEQVLLNLLINARQAMLGKGGSLTIKAAQSEDQIKIQVIDNGPGIPEKLMPKIFQPFFTTKGTARSDEAHGTGLGLTICKEIIEHHHGHIQVESEVGKGTTFTVFLPAAKPPPASSSPATQPPVKTA